MAVRRAWPQISSRVLPKYTRYGDSVTRDQLEVDRPLINRRARLTVTDQDRFEARLSGRNAVTGHVAEMVRRGLVSGSVARGPSAPLRAQRVGA